MMLMNVKQNVEIKGDESFSINLCIEEALQRYPFSEEERKLVHFEKGEDFFLKGNSLYMQHVFFNLIKNSLYAILAARKGEIFISVKTLKSIISCFFKDTALGLSENEIDLVFKKFYTKKMHGTGIGLSYCQMVVEAYAGCLNVKANPENLLNLL